MVADIECPLCLQVFVEPVAGACGHAFCAPCAGAWLDACAPRGACGCPLCRAPLRVEDMAGAAALARAVEARAPAARAARAREAAAALDEFRRRRAAATRAQRWRVPLEVDAADEGSDSCTGSSSCGGGASCGGDDGGCKAVARGGSGDGGYLWAAAALVWQRAMAACGVGAASAAAATPPALRADSCCA